MEDAGSRGARLWRDMSGDSLSAGQRVLLEEACRIADRLDKIDDFLRGREESWMKFHARNDDGSIVEVVIDKALAEARQQAVALKQIVAEIRVSGAKDNTGSQGGGSDELARRREERRQAAGL